MLNMDGKKWQSIFCQSNSIYLFLIEVSQSLLDYLNQKNTAIENTFSKALFSNPLFDSYHNNLCDIDKDQNIIQLFEKSKDFLNNIYIITDYRDLSLGLKSRDEYENELRHEIENYINDLDTFINLDRHELKSTQIRDSFIDDLDLIKNKLRIDGNLFDAEKALLYWKDVIDDIILQKTLVDIRFNQIICILKKGMR